MIQRILNLLPVSRKGVIDRYYLIRSRWGFGVKLHRIHTSDPNFHTHPWNGISIVLGSYAEERVHGDGSREYRPTVWLNFVAAYRPHRVTLHQAQDGSTPAVWTIFIHGPRINDAWSFFDDNAGVLTPQGAAPWRGPDITPA